MAKTDAGTKDPCTHPQQGPGQPMVMSWTTDLDGRVTWVSSSVEQLLGWDAEDAVGRTVDEYLTPSSIRIIGDAIRASVTSDPPRDGINEQISYLHRDGHEIACVLRVTFIRDDAGRIVQLDGVSQGSTS